MLGASRATPRVATMVADRSDHGVAVALRLLVLALVPAPALAGDPPILDAGAAYLYVDNLNQALVAEDEVADGAVEAFARGRFAFRPGGEDSGTELAVLADAALVRMDSYDDLDRAQLGLAVELTRRLGRTYTSPWLTVGAGATLLRHGDSALRDGVRVEARALLGRRVTERLSVRGTVAGRARRAREDRVFDTSSRSAGLGADLAFGRVTGFVDVAWIAGDFVATATPNAMLVNRADVISAGADPAYGPGPSAAKRYSYRFEGDAITAGAGLDWAPGRAWGLTLQGFWRQTETDWGTVYEGWSASAELRYRTKRAR
jgi:hypothetical protein